MAGDNARGGSHPGARLARFAIQQSFSRETVQDLKEHLNALNKRFQTGKPFTLKAVYSRMRGLSGQNPDEFFELLFNSIEHDGCYAEMGLHYSIKILDRYGDGEDK
jgi:hypothetical protein